MQQPQQSKPLWPLRTYEPPPFDGPSFLRLAGEELLPGRWWGIALRGTALGHDADGDGSGFIRAVYLRAGGCEAVQHLGAWEAVAVGRADGDYGELGRGLGEQRVGGGGGAAVVRHLEHVAVGEGQGGLGAGGDVAGEQQRAAGAVHAQHEGVVVLLSFADGDGREHRDGERIRSEGIACGQLHDGNALLLRGGESGLEALPAHAAGHHHRADGHGLQQVLQTARMVAVGRGEQHGVEGAALAC